MPTELEVANSGVEEAERHIARQRALLESLDPADSLKEVSTTLLREIEAQLAAEKQNRDWIVRNGWSARLAKPR